MRIAISRHFGADLHTIRHAWSLADLIEAHATLDYLEELQEADRAEQGTRDALRSRKARR